MNPATLTLIVIASFGAVFLAMAALLRAMVTDKLDGIVVEIRSLRTLREEDKNKVHTLEVKQIEISGKIYALDGRVATIEARCGIGQAWPASERRCGLQSQEGA